MYKDVWKRFGAKILIVMCSVLLLGGVAIAAPRLRAAQSVDNQKFVAVDEQSLEYIGNNTPVFPKTLRLNSIVINYSGDENQTESQDTLSKYINYGSNIKLRLQEGNWTQATQNEAVVKVGVKFPSGYTIKDENGNDVSLTGTGICEYKIKPQTAGSVTVTLNNADKYSNYNNENRLMMGPLRALAPSDFKVTVIDGKGNTVDLSSSGETEAGYEVYDTKTFDTQQINPKPANYGSYNCFIKLKNYQLSDQYQSKPITITHHIKDYDVTVGGVVKTLKDDVLSEHPGTDSIKLKIKGDDDIVESDLNGSYTVNNYQRIPNTNPQQYKIVIEGKSDKCFGSLELGPYTISEKMEQFVLVKQGESASDDSFDTTVPYDEEEDTYRIQNMGASKIQEYSLFQKKSTGYEKVATYNADTNDPTLPKWNSVVFDASDCHFMKNGDPIPGATAGILQQKITVGGVTGYLIYRVSRELLVDGKINEKLQFDSPIDKDTKKTQPNNTYEYDGSQHRMIPQMYFKAANGETIDEAKKPYLELDKDYSLDWKYLQDSTSGTWGKDVGTVAMQVTGKGLYSEGKLIPNGAADRDEKLQNIRYRVTGQVVSKQNSFSVKLLNSDLDEQYNFILNTTAQQIISSAQLCKEGRGIFFIEDAEKNHTTFKPSFFRKTAGVWTEVDIPNNNFSDFKFNAPGDYRVVFALGGNYVTPDGKGIELAEREISCEFTIDAFDITEYEFSIVGCEPDYNIGCDNEFVAGKNHIYNGKPHKPQVEMRKRSDNSLVDSINGELYSVDHYRYVTDPESTERSDLTDAGKAIAYVKVVGYELRQVEFTIEPRQLETANIVFSEKDGFRNIEETTTSGAAIHPYNGKTPPEVTELGIRHTQIDRSTVLQAGNADNNKDFTIIEGLFDADGQSSTDIDINGQYYYKIKLANSNYKSDNRQNTLLVGPFRFEAKDISKATIDPLVDVIGYDQYVASSTNNDDRGRKAVEKYLKGEFQNKKLTVTDGSDTLVYGTDYVITSSGTNALKDMVSEDGTIVFTLSGKNCYTGETARIKINVGTDIVDSTVYAQKNNDSNGARPDPASFEELRTAVIKGAYDAPTLSNPYVLDFLKKGEMETLDKTYLYLDGTKLLYEENYGPVSVDSEYDASTDKTYCIVNISGRNGYYGNVSIKVQIRKRSLNSDNCTVEVLDADYTYIGKGHRIPVQLKVMYGTVELKEGTDYEIWYDVTDDKAPIDASTYPFYLKGLKQYEGEKRGANQMYTIKPRNIATTVSGGAINTSKFEIDMAKSYTYVKGGFRPVVKLKYRINEDDEWLELTDKEFKYTPYNTDHVSGSSEPDEEHARVYVEGRGNFCGNFTELFNINPVDMERDCRIEMSPSIYDFRAKDIRPADGNHGLGSNVTFVVRQRVSNDVTIEGGGTGGDVTVDGDERWMAIDPGEYDTGYSGNYYVSGDFVTTSDGSEYTEPTSIKVTGLYNPQNPSEGGNYRGSLTRTFTIRGDLAAEVADPTDATNIFSKTTITKNEIPYSTLKDKAEGSTNIGNSGMEVQFQQQERVVDDKGIGAGAGSKGHYATRILKWGQDYEVYLTDINSSEPLGKVVPQVGVHSGRIEGTGNFIGKQENVDIFITGNLGDDEETEVNPNPKQNGVTLEDGVIVIRSDSTDIKLQDYISVKCGGRTLDYGKEYRFIEDGSSDKDAEPNMAPGQRSIRITYTNESKSYLRGDRLIKYWVKQELDLEKYNVTGVEENYEYNHGSPVIDLDEVQVRYDTTLLKRDRDYTIEFEKNDGYSVNPEHKVIITPIGNYSGDAKKLAFAVTKYDLAKNQQQIKIDADSTTIYTGKDVFPTINSVVVKARIVSGGGVASNVNIFGEGDTEKPGFTEAAYALRPVEGQDNINFQNRIEVDCVLAGVGNYTGEIKLKYSILQKNIEDMTDEQYDIRFYTPEQNYPYQNGDSIEPEPRGEYNGLTLIGRKDTGSGSSSFGRDVSFIFTYPKDTINVGTKTITITGNGNFTGVRTLDYNITQLDLANTELKFADAELIYDRHEQHPSFTLSYGGKQIVTYDKTNGVKSDYINNIKVTFENATNATKPGQLASVMLSFDEKDQANSNYTGTKTAQFAIQPASLEGHVAFMYHPEGEAGNIEVESNLHLPWTGESVKPVFPIQEPTFKDTDLAEGEAGAIYEFAGKRNSGDFLKRAANADATVGNGDYTIDFKYVEPDSEDVDVRDDYGDADGRKNCTLAGKVRVTITGINNYKDSASFWYYIGDDISADGSAKLQTNTAIYNAKKQPPTVIVSGISRDKYTVARYRGEVKNENFITEKDIIDAATYYIRLEGNPTKGTYATKPITLTYTIQPRAISNSVVIDGFKKEYNYTGLAICPVGISVTDYIDRTKYKLTENEDYSLTYTNNINVGTATINVNGEGNFKGTAAARFAITSSMISGGSNGTPGGSVSNGSGQISGAVAVAPDDVRVTLDAGNAMYYTGKQLTPAVTISGMTQNTDYTVTYSNNIEVGTGVITITGMGNNTGTITKNFRIVAKLSDCKVTNIPDQQYTGSAVEPLITVTCGNSILTKDKDYTVSFVNNVEIGTATAMIRAAGNSNYIGSLEAKFNIGNNVGGFIVSGYAPTYPYTGSAITPAVTVESGSTRLQQGTDYTVSYENNVDAGSASIIVKGAGKYTGTQTVNFIIEPRSIQVCDTTEVEDKTYTGDAYTPSITVRDSGKVLQNGVDYTLTYSDNVNPGLATITIQGLSNNYTGTKKITFRIGGVAVSGLQVSAVNATSIKLKWQQQGYADGYQVCNSKSKVIKTVNGSNASTTVAGLKPGKTYKYKVRSYTTNSQGERSYSAASAVVTATTKLKTPAVTLKRNGTGRMRIKWTKSTNADGYEIFYKNTKSAKYRRIKKVDDVNTRICNVRGIKSGKKCYVRVRAYKKTGSTTLRSAMSKTKTIKVK